jgi:replicative DNA helicase
MTPPHSKSAERHVLGVCMTWPDRVDEVSDFVQAGDFYVPAHGPVFESIVRLAARGSSTDAGAVADDMRTHGTLDDVGGPGVLVALVDGAPTQAGVVDSAKRVASTARVRAVITSAQDIVYRGMNGDYGDAGEFCDGAEAQVMDAAKGRRVVDAVPMGQVVRETMGWLQSLPTDGVPFGVATGLRLVDKWLCGLQPAAYYLIAGHTSHGKTALAMQIAADCGVPVLLCSAEMSARQLVLRALANESGLPTWRILSRGYWGADGTRALLDAADNLHGNPIMIDDRGAMTPARVASRARRLKQSKGIGLVIVDYINIFSPSIRKRGDSREREVAAMSGEFKALAKQIDCPVVVLAQLNRKNGSDRPQVENLRDSGTLGQDADAILFVHRPEKGKRNNDEPEPAEIIVAKNRITGPLGVAEVTFDPNRVRFVDTDHGPDVATLPEKDPLDGLVED